MTQHYDADESDRYFLAEALELLATIEQDLLMLVDDPSPARIHSLMRAAHTLKGAAASVERNGIQEVAHVLEDIFTALYSPSAVIDDQVESLLFQGYECLRLLLSAASAEHTIDETDILNRAAAVIAQLQDILGDCFNDETPMPSSADLGFDIVQSMFETGVSKRLDEIAQGINTARQQADWASLSTALRTHVEVLLGLAESLSLPGFGAIAQATLDALSISPEQIQTIAPIALENLRDGQAQVLSGDRTQGGYPSPELLQCVEGVSPLSLPKASPKVSPREPFPLDELAFDIDVSEMDDFDVSVDPQSTSQANPQDNDEIEEGANFTADLEAALQADLTDLEWNLEQGTEPLSQLATPQLANIENGADLAAELEVESGFAIEPESPLETDLEAEFDIEIDPEPQPSLETRKAMTHKTPSSQVHSELARDLDASLEDDLEDDLDLEVDIESSDPINPVESIDSLTDAARGLETDLEASFHQNLGKDLGKDLGEESPVAIDPHPKQMQTQRQFPSNREGSALGKDGAAVSRRGTTLAKSSQTADSTVTPSPRPLPLPSSSIRVNVERLENLEHIAGDLLTQQTKQATDNQQMLFALRYLTNAVQQHLSTLQELQSQTERIAEAQQFHQRRSQLGLSPGSTISGSGGFVSGGFASGAVSALDGVHKPSQTGTFGLDTLELDDYNDQQILLQQAIEEALQIETTVTAVDQIRKRTGHTLQLKKRLLSSLQDDITTARMQSLGSLMGRFPRVLQQLVSAYGKKADLTLEGMDVLVDRVIVEKLYDPMLHLIRNAFDHGIEPSAERQALGKLETGHITIRALSKGTQTIIEVSDDGRGADVRRIADKAIALNLKSAAEIRAMTEAALLDLVFHPGFSTSDALSALSGRGVGLDVVRSQLEALHGRVTIQSLPGQGTTFTLYLPTSLTITQLLLFRVDTTIYAVAIDAVERVMCVTPSQFRQFQNTLALQPAGPNGSTVRLHQVADLMQYSATAQTLQQQAIAASSTETPFKKPLLPLHESLRQVLLLKTAVGTQGLLVDQILGEQELVVRSLSPVVPTLDYVQGCCVLGNNQLALVIDLVGLLETSAVTTSVEGQGARISAWHPAAIAPAQKPAAEEAASGSSFSGSSASESALCRSKQIRSNSPGSATSSPQAEQAAASERHEAHVRQAVEAAVSQVQASRPVSPSGSAVGKSQLPALLVVDDSATFRHVLSSSLEQAGYQVLQAYDGMDAINKLRQTPTKPVVVICDVEMPRLNGYQFLMQKAQDPSTADIPVVMLTSRSGEKHRKIAVELGASTYMTKPFDQKRLIETINELIQGSVRAL